MKNLEDKQCWLFDMDGTLTHAIHDFDAIRKTLELPVGQPILESLSQLAPDLAAKKHRQLDLIEMEIAADATAQPGCHALLDHLHKRGKQTGIITRNGRLIADATLKAAQLSDYFKPDTIISRDCCSAKPDPAGIQLLLERWSADTRDAVMVGDYHFDLQAGRNAGVMTVHLDVTGQFAWPALTDVQVQTLDELLALLD